MKNWDKIKDAIDYSKNKTHIKERIDRSKMIDDVKKHTKKLQALKTLIIEGANSKLVDEDYALMIEIVPRSLEALVEEVLEDQDIINLYDIDTDEDNPCRLLIKSAVVDI